MLVSAIALSLVILWFDLSLPLGVAGGVPYEALVLLGIWFPHRNDVFILAVVSSVLTILGYFLSPVGGISWVVLTNRGLALFAIWITAVLIALYKRAEQNRRHSNQKLEAVGRIGAWATETLQLDEVLARVLRGTLEITDASVGMIFLMDPETRTLSWGASLGLSESFVDSYRRTHIELGEGLTGGIAETGESIHILENSSHDPRVVRSVIENEGFNSFIGVPVLAEGEIIAVMNIMTKPPDVLSGEEIVLVSAIGTHIGSSIRNARMFTALAMAEAALGENEARYRELFSNMASCVAIYEGVDDGLDFVFKNINQAAEKTESFKQAEVLGRRVTEVFPGVEAFGLLDVFQRVWKTGRSEHFPVTLYTDDRISGWRDNYVYKLPSGEIVTVYEDVTERKRFEEIITLSEERFRSSFENAPNGNVVIGDTGVIEVFNAAAEKIFGYSRDEVIGRNVSMLMPEPDRAHHDSHIRNYLETGDAKVIGIGREVTGLRKNGEEFPMQLGIGEMQVGTRRSFIGTIADLTELKTLEQQLFHVHRMEAVGQLTGGIAHDFNNLLAVMVGNAALLGDVAGDDEEARHSIEAIEAAVARGASLTSRLLAFSRQSILLPVAADVTGLIGSLGDMLRRTLGETIDLRVEQTPALWPAQIDAHQFENALVNLAINARDAMERGGALTIETANVTLDEAYAKQHEEVTPGDYVEVSVSDTGGGMAPEVLERVFEPFFTTKVVGKGTGLGLSMVFGFVKQSKGHVTIYSEMGQGTTVKLFLPRSGEDVARQDTRSETGELARGSERILVVEDDAFVREIPARFLRKQGYDVVEAVDGKEAIEHLRDGRPFDLLFTDVVLPGGMNGVEIAEEAKRIQPGIKVLYTTGYAENAVVHDGLLDPDVSLLSKPYLPAKLLDKMRATLDSGDD